MSYAPKTWTTGETVTASGLNHIEQGIAGAGSALICNCDYSSQEDNYVLDKTVQEIYDALLSGTPVYIKTVYGTLGASGTGDYSSSLMFAPIIKIYGYNYANTIRICASRPNICGNVGGKIFVHSPSVLIFSATGMNQYPVMYASASTDVDSVYVNASVF